DSGHCPGASKIQTKESKEGIDLNWIWIQSKKKAATDTAMRLLVAFLAGVDFHRRDCAIRSLDERLHY
ncbi:MAG: hypothetical protein ACM3WP_18860, partial [Acidobacteriota bacterium]